jgi:hypothetical protein
LVGGICRICAKAWAADAKAASQSDQSLIGKFNEIDSPVAGFIEQNVAPKLLARHWPSIKTCSAGSSVEFVIDTLDRVVGVGISNG